MSAGGRAWLPSCSCIPCVFSVSWLSLCVPSFLTALPSAAPLPYCRVHEAFLHALVEAFIAKRPPFNVSLINDHMKKADRRWNVQDTLGCSFSQLCEVMERRGVLELRRLRDGAEVAGSRYAAVKAKAAAAAAPPPRRRSRSPPARSPREGPPAGGAADGERWQMGGE